MAEVKKTSKHLSFAEDRISSNCWRFRATFTGEEEAATACGEEICVVEDTVGAVVIGRMACSIWGRNIWPKGVSRTV